MGERPRTGNMISDGTSGNFFRGMHGVLNAIDTKPRGIDIGFNDPLKNGGVNLRVVLVGKKPAEVYIKYITRCMDEEGVTYFGLLARGERIKTAEDVVEELVRKRGRLGIFARDEGTEELEGTKVPVLVYTLLGNLDATSQTL